MMPDTSSRRSSRNISSQVSGNAVLTSRAPGRRPLFSADDVVSAAIRLGLSTFSVAAVARELGVTTAAVYRRFPSHEALREECLTRILGEVPPLAVESSWQETLRLAADEWWTLCMKYPELPHLISSYREQPTWFVTTPFQSYGRRLIASGFTLQQAYFVASLLISALNLVSRLPAEDTSPRSRDFLQEQAVEIIVSGISNGNTGWQIVGRGEKDL